MTFIISSLERAADPIFLIPISSDIGSFSIWVIFLKYKSILIPSSTIANLHIYYSENQAWLPSDPKVHCNLHWYLAQLHFLLLSSVTCSLILMNSSLKLTHITISITKLLHVFFFSPRITSLFKVLLFLQDQTKNHFHCEAFLEFSIHIPVNLANTSLYNLCCYTDSSIIPWIPWVLGLCLI